MDEDLTKATCVLAKHDQACGDSFPISSFTHIVIFSVGDNVLDKLFA